MERENPQQLGPGIITVNEWLMASNGSTYLHFWSPEWEIGNEKDVLGKTVRGNSGFFVMARPNCLCDPYFIVPGCRFSSFAKCVSRPIADGPGICEITFRQPSIEC